MKVSNKEDGSDSRRKADHMMASATVAETSTMSSIVVRCIYREGTIPCSKDAFYAATLVFPSVIPNPDRSCIG